MFEKYRLVLTHYAVNSVTGENFKLDEPICVEQVFDRRYGGSPILINRLFDELKAYTLARAERDEDGSNVV